MKTINVSADRLTVTLDGVDYPFTCVVRNELNGLRALHNPRQVHLSTNGDGSDGKPVMPRPFPSGTSNVLGVIPGNGGDLGPIVVTTDAHQQLPVWALDAEGGYDHAIDELIDDWGYEFHADLSTADGPYSVGCLHSGGYDPVGNINRFAEAVKAALTDGPVVVTVA